MPDEMIECLECKQDFPFTERDQQFYQEKGFTKPKRCRDCRNARKEQGGKKPRK